MELRYYNLSPGAITQIQTIFDVADVVVDYLTPTMELWRTRVGELQDDCDAAYAPAGSPSLMKILIDGTLPLSSGIENAFKVLSNGGKGSSFTENTFISGSNAAGFNQDGLDVIIALNYVVQGSADPAPPAWVATWNPVNAAALIASPILGQLQQKIGEYLTFSGYAK